MTPKSKKKIENLGVVPLLYTTLEKEASGKFTEKKSVFIGTARPVKTEADAQEFIKKISKQYSDATHNVWAYLLKEGNLSRCSDNGEPQGTAGVPTLDVIKKSGIEDVVVVVTRYFGGILLGTGGLVRAYSSGARIAIEQAHIVTYESYTEFKITCNYAEYQKIAYELPFYGILQDSVQFEEQITLHLAIKEAAYATFAQKIAEMTAGKGILQIIGKRFA